MLIAQVQELRGDDQRLDTSRLAEALEERGTPATACASIEDLRQGVLGSLESGDLFVTMSSGNFEGLPHSVAAALQDEA